MPSTPDMTENVEPTVDSTAHSKRTVDQGSAKIL